MHFYPIYYYMPDKKLNVKIRFGSIRVFQPTTSGFSAIELFSYSVIQLSRYPANQLSGYSVILFSYPVYAGNPVLYPGFWNK